MTFVGSVALRARRAAGADSDCRTATAHRRRRLCCSPARSCSLGSASLLRGRRQPCTWSRPPPAPDLCGSSRSAIALAPGIVAFGRSGHADQPAAHRVEPLRRCRSTCLWGLGASAAGLIGEGGWCGRSLSLVLAVVGAVGSLARGGRRMRSPLVSRPALAQPSIVRDRADTRPARLPAVRRRPLRVRRALSSGCCCSPTPPRRLPWRGTWRPALVGLPVPGLLQQQRAALRVRRRQDGPDAARRSPTFRRWPPNASDPCLDPNGAVDPLVMPVETNPAAYYRAIDRYGDPSAGLPIGRSGRLRPGRARQPAAPGCNESCAPFYT